MPTTRDALNGARDILAEGLTENADLLGRLRGFMQSSAVVKATVVPGQEQAGAKFSDYFDHTEAWATIPSHRALALLRASKEGVVTLDIAPDGDEGAAQAEAIVGAVLDAPTGAPGDTWLRKMAGWTWRVKLSTSMMLDLLGDMRAQAHEEAIKVFARNLKDLLLAAPAGLVRDFRFGPDDPRFGLEHVTERTVLCGRIAGQLSDTAGTASGRAVCECI